MSNCSADFTRGYCGIGVENAKNIKNIGTLWRSAYCLGASFFFTIGSRYEYQSSDTTKTWKHLAYWRFRDWDDFHEHIPHDCQLVAVELVDNARPLETFTHPERAIYLLGPEDGGLSKNALVHAQHVVKFTSKLCLNVAAAGSVVLYDRRVKSCPAKC